MMMLTRGKQEKEREKIGGLWEWGELMTDCRGVSPADSPCTGQNAETRSNGAPLGRALMLFLTPVLNMPGAAGFSARASCAFHTVRQTEEHRLDRQNVTEYHDDSSFARLCRAMLIFILFWREDLFLKLQPVGFFHDKRVDRTVVCDEHRLGVAPKLVLYTHTHMHIQTSYLQAKRAPRGFIWKVLSVLHIARCYLVKVRVGSTL